MHCIISSGGLTSVKKLRKSKETFFIPIRVLRDKFQGKFLAMLDELYQEKSLSFSSSCKALQSSLNWNKFKNDLYNKEWCPYIKKTFHGFGNAIEYLGRYTHKIAISNYRILSVNNTEVSLCQRKETWGTTKNHYNLKWRIHSQISYACASFWFSKDTLLRFSE